MFAEWREARLVERRITWSSSRQVVELAFIGLLPGSRHTGCDHKCEARRQRITVAMGVYRNLSGAAFIVSD